MRAARIYRRDFNHAARGRGVLGSRVLPIVLLSLRPVHRVRRLFDDGISTPLINMYVLAGAFWLFLIACCWRRLSWWLNQSTLVGFCHGWPVGLVILIRTYRQQTNQLAPFAYSGIPLAVYGLWFLMSTVQPTVSRQFLSPAADYSLLAGGIKHCGGRGEQCGTGESI